MLGVNTWNNWRERNPSEKPDLSGATLRTPYWIDRISRSDEERYSYEDLDKYVARKREREKFANRIICGNNLKLTSFLGANLKGINFSQVDLREADLWGANLCEAALQSANLAGARLEFANLKNADLSQTDLHGSSLRAAGLSGAILSGANLKSSDLSSADLRKANLVGADLSSASLSRANLIEADLRGATLRHSDFSIAKLRAANFDKAQIDNVIFNNVDLSEVIKLAAARHLGPSTVSIETLFLSKGHLPLSFLRGVGMPETLITYLPSLTEQALQFYSCFISYSHADKPFARRLHDSLQGKGIRCWLDEHEMLPGQKIYTEVDKGIRLSDKVLLCCSKASLTSWWVDNEIEIAFDAEQSLRKEHGSEVLVLIPLNLDGYLFSKEYKDGKSTQIKARLAADFTGWESDYKRFDEQLERLVKALESPKGKRTTTPEPQ